MEEDISATPGSSWGDTPLPEEFDDCQSAGNFGALLENDEASENSDALPDILLSEGEDVDVSSFTPAQVQPAPMAAGEGGASSSLTEGMDLHEVCRRVAKDTNKYKKREKHTLEKQCENQTCVSTGKATFQGGGTHKNFTSEGLPHCATTGGRHIGWSGQ